MVAGIAAQKGDAAVFGAVADHKAENLGVEIDHLRHVMDIEPDMAEARGFLHRSVPPSLRSFSDISARRHLSNRLLI
jgi:hypothetical protein